MSRLAAYCAVDAWAEFGGSHIRPQDWAQYPRLILAGVDQALYILWPQENVQDRDLERLSNDAGQLGLGFRSLALRLGWDKGVAFPAANEFVDKFAGKLDHARAQGYGLSVIPANEPNIEAVCTPEQFLAWYTEVVRLLRARWPGLKIISPAVAPYNDSAWPWWDQAIRACCAMSDLGGIHLYPTVETELQFAWSLPWWQGQIPDRPLVVCEMGCRSGTPESVRNTLLPKLWRQVRDCEQVQMAAWFVQWTAGSEHQQHWWTPPLYEEFIRVATELPNPEPPTPGTVTLAPGAYRLTVAAGGVTIAPF